MATIEVRRTSEFDLWLTRVRDRRARTKILVRLDRLTLGNFGDVKSVSAGVSEMRIDYGPGYRLYLTWRGSVVVIMLCGGDKSTQDRDIEHAKMIAGKLQD